MIVQVQMINCQSWKNSTFDLATDRINVIIADNGTGKSVFFKMLKITTNPNYFSRAERKDLIRRHEECATILFKFDDGSIAATKVFQTYVLYMYKASNQEGLKTAYEQFPEVLEKLGLIVDPDETSFVANIIDADQDLLLVNSKLKYNYNLVHLLVESPELELVNERAHTALMNVLNPLSSLSSRCETLERAIQDSTYYDVAERELELDRVEKMKDFLFDLIPVAENLHSMQEVSRNYIDVDGIKKLLGLLDLLESIDLSQVVITDKPANIADKVTEYSGIVFLDEIDKVAVKGNSSGADVSREGVQRDILPIVEGSQVSTKYGPVRTDHILFIAAGAFHMAKPSDLIPELQGRFPIRVELKSLRKEDFERILTEPQNALIKQYEALLATEGITLSFKSDAISRIAELACEVNEQAEDIGARRLHTLLEKVLEDISFRAPELTDKDVVIDAAYVNERLADIVVNRDLSQFIL